MGGEDRSRADGSRRADRYDRPRERHRSSRSRGRQRTRGRDAGTRRSPPRQAARPRSSRSRSPVHQRYTRRTRSRSPPVGSGGRRRARGRSRSRSRRRQRRRGGRSSSGSDSSNSSDSSASRSTSRSRSRGRSSGRAGERSTQASDKTAEAAQLAENPARKESLFSTLPVPAATVGGTAGFHLTGPMFLNNPVAMVRAIVLSTCVAQCLTGCVRAMPACFRVVRRQLLRPG